MPYISGSANTMSNLQQQVVDACVANGWTWHATNSVLYKGDAYIRLYLYDSNNLQIRGQEGLAITGSGIYFPSSMNVNAGITGYEWVWPITFELFIFTDEVYVIINYRDIYYQWFAFGISSLAEKLPGSGVWFDASFLSVSPSISVSVSLTNAVSTNPVLFRMNNYQILHNLTNAATASAVSWYLESSTPLAQSAPLLTVLPGSFDNGVVLLPVVLYASGATFTIGSSQTRRSIVAQLEHVRYTRNTYFAPGEIVTIGYEHWKIFPFYRKYEPTPNGGAHHSGTLAMALRYEGS